MAIGFATKKHFFYDYFAFFPQIGNLSNNYFKKLL